MSGLDLNEIPYDDDFQDAEDNNFEPHFCTQGGRNEVVGESPDPNFAHKVAGGGSDVHSGMGNQNNPPQTQ
jgi:hypothetical protein